MRESEILSATPCQSGVPLVIPLLLRRHFSPRPISLLISEYVIKFREYKQSDSQTIDNDQILVSSVVQRLIVSLINEC